ncbi:hypothetical protein Patl1_04194 [Pistacia atlantica]|uniref:Uncharacterized protein n=1 Tax=Pistacia atlantica TaxID=434234 RepID=A0ACC1BSC4_9ROSI|nr:hypothetical protein Patl1_04194 [Pistacia atlantica]
MKDIEAASLITFKSLYHTLEYLCLKGVTGCDSILPSIDKGGLNKLISLVLEDCKDVKCIIDTTQLHVPAPPSSNLVKLSLRRLNLLREICCGPHGKLQSVSLENLETVYVEECPSMCSLFPAMLLQRLYKLKEVTIYSCNNLEEIFQLDGLCHSGEENLVMLSSLAELDLKELPQLRCIWKGPTHIVNLKSLTKVEVRKCKSLIYLFTLSVAQSLVQLKSLEVSDCESLKHLIVTEEGDNDEISSEHDLQIHSPFLSKLESLKIYSCERLEHIFPISFARVLVQLKEFTVGKAPQLKQVFYLDNGSEENVVAGDGKETNLRILRIGSWNQLYDTLLSGLKDGFFKNLEELSINRCGVKVLFPLEDGEQHLFSLPNLKTLEVGYLPELEGLCSKSPTLVLSLENLTTLDLYHCDRLRNIFSPSLAQNLSQLQGYISMIVGNWRKSLLKKMKRIKFYSSKISYKFMLYMYDNSELEEVFGDKDVADVMDHKEIVLPQLDWLRLRTITKSHQVVPSGLSLHISIFEGGVLVIKGCPKMSTRFSVGEDRCVHAKAKAFQIAEFPSEPFIDIMLAF